MLAYSFPTFSHSVLWKEGINSLPFIYLLNHLLLSTWTCGYLFNALGYNLILLFCFSDCSGLAMRALQRPLWPFTQEVSPFPLNFSQELALWDLVHLAGSK